LEISDRFVSLFWASLFCHKDVLYVLGLSTEYGNLQIACSKDEGLSWSAPVTLFYGSNGLCKYGGVHRAPMHMISYNGRLYTTCEYGCWIMGSHLPGILSIEEEADLMQPENWHWSDLLPFDGAWKEATERQKPGQKQRDTMEGNIVIGTDGKMYSYLRWKRGSMLKLRVNTEDPDKAPEFVEIIDAPVTNSMFRIIPIKGKYVMICNRNTPSTTHWRARNVLSLCESVDGDHYVPIQDIFNFEKEDPELVGFQYPAFLYEDNQLSLVVRSAFNQAKSSHDANYTLFCRINIAEYFD